jgi:negative regulator of flagellin synthesis FlgM
MKVYFNKPPEIKDVSSSVQKATGSKTKGKVGNEGKMTSGDRVEISGKAKELMVLIEQLPEVRADKLEAIKKAIESGSYKIDSLKIANRILEER